MLPSASRAELVDICLGSATHDGPDEVNEHATLGTVKHAFLRRCLDVSREVALAELSEPDRDACAALDVVLPHAMPGTAVGEPAYALDIDTGVARELGRDLGRDYAKAGLRENELPGSTDLRALLEPGVGLVVDYKSGRKRVTRAKDNPQIHHAVVGLADSMGLDVVVGAVLYTPEDDEPRWDFHTFDAFAIASAREGLISRGRLVRSARLAPEHVRLAVGPHCKRCPGLGSCRAHTALLRRVISDPTQWANEEEQILNLDPPTAALVYNRVQALKTVIKRVEASLYAYASRTPIPLGDGKFFGSHTKLGNEELDGDVAFSVLAPMVGADFALKAFKLNATKAGIKRALEAYREERAKHGEGVKISKRQTEVLEAIRAKGGATRTPTTTIEEFTPQVTASATAVLGEPAAAVTDAATTVQPETGKSGALPFAVETP